MPNTKKDGETQGEKSGFIPRIRGEPTVRFLCGIKRGGRKRPPLGHKARQCRAFLAFSLGGRKTGFVIIRWLANNEKSVIMAFTRWSERWFG